MNNFLYLYGNLAHQIIKVIIQDKVFELSTFFIRRLWYFLVETKLEDMRGA